MGKGREGEGEGKNEGGKWEGSGGRLERLKHGRSAGACNIKANDRLTGAATGNILSILNILNR